MSWRSALLVILALVMVIVAIVTWGSVGSLIMVFCLIMMGLGLLYSHFLTNRDDSDYFLQ